MQTLQEFEKEIIMSRLVEMHGNRTHTARSLGIGVRTLQRKLTAYGVNRAGQHLKRTWDKEKNMYIVEAEECLITD